MRRPIVLLSVLLPSSLGAASSSIVTTTTRRSSGVSFVVVVPSPPAAGGGRRRRRRRRHGAVRPERVRIDPRGGPRPSGDWMIAPPSSSSSSSRFGGGGLDDVDVATTTTTTAPDDASLAPPRPPNRVVPSQLAEALDLVPLLVRVSKYARTRRGAEAIVRLVAPPPAPIPPSFFKGGRRRRKDRYYDYDASWKRPDDDDDGAPMVLSVASSAEMARSEYGLVREATDVLLRSSPTRIGGRRTSSSSSSAATAAVADDYLSSDGTTSPFEVSLPPTFDLFDGEDRPIDDIDDDDWMGLCPGPPPPPGTTDSYEQQIDLRAILQAEQVVKLLMDTRAWAERDGTRMHVPGLSNVARMITECDDDDWDDGDGDGDGDGMEEERSRLGPLVDLHRALEGAVEIVRAGPSLSDPDNRRSYAFRLAKGKFPELDALREREGRLLTKIIARRDDYDDGRELAVVRGEISTMEDLVGRKLGLAVARAARRVSRAMDALARLDAIFAKALYGLDWGGEIPDVGMGGRLRVIGFVHPVLALRREGGDGDVSAGAVAPVDLLVPGKGEGHRALIISGPNGGGKTLALKSFGLAAIMAKLAIPIPTVGNAGDERRPIVDYFDDVLVEVGDSQNIRRRESTLMARLNSFSTLIQRMANTTSDGSADAKLILLDELGGGTDPVAGSALAQSILEKLIFVSSDCSVVATTHSPQLKALSANDCRFKSASVLMNDARHPTFRLSYGTTGESFALEAARRARPSLPDDVIQRAAELMNGDDDVAANSLQRYLTALEQEQRNARELVEETEATYREVLEYKDDMISKIQVAKMQLSRLESRLGDIFKSLKGIEGDAYELVGDSLGEVRLMKRKLQTEEEQLSKKGLRRVPESYSFYEGETVVIIADSEFKGYDAVVKEVDVENPLIVKVVPVLDLFSFNEDDAQEPLALRRRDVAIFDYPKWGLSDDKFAGDRNKRNKLISVLSTLTTSEKKNTSATKAIEDKTPFISARQRKASAAAEQKKSSKAKKRVK